MMLSENARIAFQFNAPAKTEPSGRNASLNNMTGSLQALVPMSE
jgi:hypothetical protein